MIKIINPSICDTYYGPKKAYAKIEYKDGNLSISGVIGPKSNGDCYGSAGQCMEEIVAGKPAAGWSEEMLQKFLEIWSRWHLNDMRPYCEHERELGWNEIAQKEVSLYHYTMTMETIKRKREAEEAALTALRNNKVFRPTKEQVKYATLPYSTTSHKELEGEGTRLYQPEKRGAIETKKLGWLRPEEHPDGILARPCPVCGYGYGTAWRKEEVPGEVIDWLFSLPASDTAPAWV